MNERETDASFASNLSRHFPVGYMIMPWQAGMRFCLSQVFLQIRITYELRQFSQSTNPWRAISSYMCCLTSRTFVQSRRDS